VKVARQQIEHGTEQFPQYSPGERIADGVVHVCGVAASIVASVILIVVAAGTGDPWVIASVSIYSLGTVAVFVISAAYHLSRPSDLKAILRRLDHAAIFVKIAGTYTPFALVSLGGVWGALLLASVWTIAAVGVPLKLFAPGRIARFALWLYLVQGWLVLGAAWPLSEALQGPELTLMAIGGALYTAGVMFYISENMKFQNAIWHGFVLAASGFMYAAILTSIAWGANGA
jgi:hemolysin III